MNQISYVHISINYDNVMNIYIETLRGIYVCIMWLTLHFIQRPIQVAMYDDTWLNCCY